MAWRNSAGDQQATIRTLQVEIRRLEQLNDSYRALLDFKKATENASQVERYGHLRLLYGPYYGRNIWHRNTAVS
jgi:hypothetical protein